MTIIAVGVICNYLSTSSVIAVVLVLLFFYKYVLDKIVRNSKHITLPPGPSGWPLVGYLSFILADNPTSLINKLRDKYGNIFGFHVGSRYCVVISDFKSVKESFHKKQYLSRPPGYLRVSMKHKNFTEMELDSWEDQRHFFSNSLKFLGIGGAPFEERVLDDISRILPKMEAVVGKPECNIRDVISSALNNSIFQLLCGRWFEDDHPIMRDFLKFQTLSAESFSNNMAFLYFPWLDPILYLIQPQTRETVKIMSNMAAFMRSELEKREQILDENINHDYLDMYLNEIKSRDKQGIKSTFTKDHLVANSLLLLMAGSDTVRNTLEWAFMCMAHFSDVQEKVYNEIISVLGSERMPSLKDKSSLPYTEAVIMESERWLTLVPLNALRWTTEETVIQGYTIPKESVIMNNLWYTHMDPEVWTSPKEFMPERFLSSDKKRVVMRECFIPFSLGKRDCPGDKMANIEVFMYFTSILQRFQIMAPKGGVDFSATHRINMQAKRPVIRVQRR